MNDPGFERRKSSSWLARTARCVPSSQTRLSCSCGSNPSSGPLLVPINGTLLRSRFLPRRDRLPSPRADSPRESIPHSPPPWLSPRRRCSRDRPPPWSPPPRSILPTRNWSSRCNAETASTMSPADSRRAITAACVMAAAALRRFRTAAQTAPRNSDLVALFSVFLPGNWSAIISAAVNSRASMAGNNATQNPAARRRTPQNMSAVRPIVGEADPLQAGPRNGFIGN